jgi:hypothetical protein
MLAPWLANVTPFTLTSPSQFRAPTPPSLTSKRYAAAYNEVKAMGAHDNSARTPEQTDLALFWNSNYLVLWNHALRDIVGARTLNIDDSARLLALASLAMADAGITAWDTKFHYVFWRPLTAIQQGDNDGNPETAGDPNWQPLINNPNYPDYTSGANNVTGAVTRMLALYFETDENTFSVGTTNAGIWEGIHFRFADVQARQQGRHVAQWVFSHFLRSVDDDDRDDSDDDRQ